MKTNTMILATMAILGSSMAFAQSGENHEGMKLRLRIAVNQGKWERLQYQNTTIGNDEVRALQSLIIDKLQKTGQFEVMERESTALDANDQEAAFDRARRDNLGERAEGMKRREVTIPADYIITPEIVSFDITSSRNDSIGLPLPISFGGSKTEDTLKLAFRISSAETSSIIATATGSASRTTKSFDINACFGGFVFGHGDMKQGLVGDTLAAAIDNTINDLLHEVSQLRWRARIADIDEDSGAIVLNRGESSGLRPGMVLDVYKLGKKIVDEQTGDVISEGKETKVGTIEVTEVEAKAAFCKILSGHGLVKGCVARPPL